MYDDFFRKAHELRSAGAPFATAVVVRAEKPTSGKPGDRAIVTLDGTMYGWIGGSCAQPTVIQEATKAMADGSSRLVRLSPDPGARELPEGVVEVPMTCFSGGTLDIFIEPHRPAPRLLVVGGLPVARALVGLGKALGYHVTAVDPTGSEPVEGADETVRDLAAIPAHVTPLTFAVVATHGEYDEPALEEILGTGAAYVGLVASGKRGDQVMASLALDGVEEDARARVRYPAGLDIKAVEGEEIALSILAEIVRVRRSMEEVGRRAAPAPEKREDVAAPAAEEAAAAPPEEPETAIDPICHMTVRVEGALHTYEHEGTTYYFCCGGCRTRFIESPDRYLRAG
ncbi:MAG TPA: XdhC family protein [Longimicrobiales bacterium]|nr:XdhC family protein [Longimicrobiales bacterium]